MLRNTWKLEHTKLCGILPKYQVLENEALKAYKDTIRESGMTYQLVPPEDHRQKITKKETQTWKYHCISVLSGIAATFSMHLWCQLIP